MKKRITRIRREDFLWKQRIDIFRTRLWRLKSKKMIFFIVGGRTNQLTNGSDQGDFERWRDGDRQSQRREIISQITRFAIGTEGRRTLYDIFLFLFINFLKYFYFYFQVYLIFVEMKQVSGDRLQKCKHWRDVIFQPHFPPFSDSLPLSP